MTPDQIQEAAASLRDAARTGEFIAPLRERYPSLDAASAYAIQHANTQRRLAEGRRRVGCKIGLTAPTVQRQLGVDQPDFGVLFDDMGWGDGEAIVLASLHQPKVEAEVAFMLGRDLAMPNSSHIDVLRAVEYVLPALEIVGSRIAAWDIGFVDTVADNASSSAFVLGGTPRRLADVDLRLCGMVMMRLGEPVSTGAGAACLGHPVNALVWLARTMSALGTPLMAGELVLSGALGPMVAVSATDVFEARIDGLGSVKIAFEGSADEGRPQ